MFLGDLARVSDVRSQWQGGDFAGITQKLRDDWVLQANVFRQDFPFVGFGQIAGECVQVHRNLACRLGVEQLCEPRRDHSRQQVPCSAGRHARIAGGAIQPAHAIGADEQHAGNHQPRTDVQQSARAWRRST